MRDLKVGLVGARGYTGREILRLLARHPRIEVAFVTSRELKGRPVAEEAPGSDCELLFEDLGPEPCAARDAHAVVLALPNGESAPYVRAIDKARPATVLVDLSSDHRFDDGWVYGQPERNRAAIARARRIANPGCYAAALQLAAEPLVPFIAGAVHAFGVSGYSGAGASPSPRNDPAALADSILPYGLVDHAHESEVARQLGRAVRFVPHVAPFFRGLSVTVSASLAKDAEPSAVSGALAARYHGEPLVEIVTDVPTIHQVRGRHTVRIGGLVVSRDGTHVAVVSVLDNLLAGAATTAIRNLNLALGLSELEGITPWLD